ncbi:MAG TPA: hypothetical protein VF461_18210 [Gemmatimonadaceae bacterium]
MPLRSSPAAPPRYDSSVERRPDPRHVFDRDPLLIPQLFVDMTPPWHTRARWRVAIVVALGIVTTMGVLVAQQGPRGAIGTVGRAGVAVMHAYTRLVAGYTPADPPPPRSR